MARPLFFMIASRGRHEVARALIGAGADVNAKNDGGWTPLHFSASVKPGGLASLDRGGADVNPRRTRAGPLFITFPWRERRTSARALIPINIELS